MCKLNLGKAFLYINRREFMDENNQRLIELDRCISEMREILNEMVLTSTEHEARLKVSQSMDELILEYMKLKYNI